MKVIGLTGAIGAGKSEVSKILKKFGAYIIEADKIGHELINSRSERKKLAEIVFSDPKKLKRLNAAMHPYIRERIREEIESRKSTVVSCQLSVVSCKLIVVDAALPQLFKGLVDEVWVVAAPKKLRVKRLLHTGLSKDQISKRMKNQLSQSEYKKLADKIILNEGTLKQLNAKIQNNLGL